MNLAIQCIETIITAFKSRSDFLGLANPYFFPLTIRMFHIAMYNRHYELASHIVEMQRVLVKGMPTMSPVLESHASQLASANRQLHLENSCDLSFISSFLPPEDPLQVLPVNEFEESLKFLTWETLV